jgi:hypothetical protein
MLGELPILVPSEVFAARIREALPMLTAPQAGDGLGADFAAKERAMRLAAQGGLRLMLSVANLYLERTGSPLPRPKLPRRADPISYAADYMFSLIMTALESQPWHLNFVETADGITVTGLAELAPPDPLGVAEPSGDATA